jgi:hypothetical protein
VVPIFEADTPVNAEAYGQIPYTPDQGNISEEQGILSSKQGIIRAEPSVLG